MRFSEANRCTATRGELRCELHKLHVERLPGHPSTSDDALRELRQHEAGEVKWSDD